jgi:hypothetical protein
MSFVMGIAVIILIYRFWDVLRTTETSAKKAAHSSLNALVKGAMKLEAQVPNLTADELHSIREGRKQLLILEDIENMSDEELMQLFTAKAPTKAKK